MRYLPPDIAYGIECASSCFDITGDVATYFFSFNDRNISAEHDALDNRNIDWESCHRNYGAFYERLFDEWFDERATDAQRVWCIRGAASDFGQRLGEKWDHVYRYYVSCSINSSHDPADEANMRRYLRQDQRSGFTRTIVTNLINRINKVDTTMIVSGFLNPQRLYEEAGIEERGNSCIQQAMQNVILEDGRLVFEGDAATVERAKLKRDLERKVRAKTKERQRVLKKSSKFLSRLIGNRDAVAFIRGDEIEVTGQRYSFKLKKSNILTTGHGGFRISVMDRETDVRLVDLCWYIPDTPALDQLAALVLAVKVGDEENIIEVGNHLRISQEAKAHADFARFLPRSDNGDLEALLNQINNINTVMGETIEQVFRRDDLTLRSTPGTSRYVWHNADTYRRFIAVANSMVDMTRMPAEIADRFALRSADQIREINGNIVTERLMGAAPDGMNEIALPQHMGASIEVVMNEPGRMDRIVNNTLNELETTPELRSWAVTEAA